MSLPQHFPLIISTGRVATTWKILEKPGKTWNLKVEPGKPGKRDILPKILEKRNKSSGNLEFLGLYFVYIFWVKLFSTVLLASLAYISSLFKSFWLKLANFKVTKSYKIYKLFPAGH